MTTIDRSEAEYRPCKVATCLWPEGGCAYRQYHFPPEHPWLAHCQARIFVDAVIEEEREIFRHRALENRGRSV